MGRDPTVARRSVDDEALASLESAARDIFAHEPSVIAVYLYGSAARREQAADLDIAVVNREAVSHGVAERWAAELQRIGAPHGPEIDLRAIAGAAPRFRATVVREGRILYESDPSARRAFERHALEEWFDFEPVWNRMRRRMYERLSGG